MHKFKKILIVEDEVIIAECLEMELISAGFDSQGYVTTGEEAIIAVNDSNPDIILMDIHLSGNLSGIETARKIRPNNDTLIIFMTGFDKTDILFRTKDLGNTNLLEKPIEIFQIEQIINDLVK